MNHDQTLPGEFAAVLDAISTLTVRSEIELTEITAPSNLAPWAVARAADVHSGGHTGQRLATGRIVILYDPDEPSTWGGAFRVICFSKSVMELELGADPLMSDVAWSWLTEAFERSSLEPTAISGTISRILNTGYGALADRSDGAEVELRASWTLHSPAVGSSVDAWLEALCQMAGLPPLPEGVAALDARRRQSHD